MGTLPAAIVIALFALLINGNKTVEAFGGSFLDWGFMTHWLLDAIPRHYLISKVEPLEMQATRAGRTGLCFIVLAIYILMRSARVFIPRKISMQERIDLEKKDHAAIARSTWSPTMWKRSNFMFTSICLSVFLVFVVEFSFWQDFFVKCVLIVSEQRHPQKE